MKTKYIIGLFVTFCCVNITIGQVDSIKIEINFAHNELKLDQQVRLIKSTISDSSCKTIVLKSDYTSNTFQAQTNVNIGNYYVHLTNKLISINDFSNRNFLESLGFDSSLILTKKSKTDFWNRNRFEFERLGVCKRKFVGTDFEWDRIVEDYFRYIPNLNLYSVYLTFYKASKEILLLKSEAVSPDSFFETIQFNGDSKIYNVKLARELLSFVQLSLDTDQIDLWDFGQISSWQPTSEKTKEKLILVLSEVCNK